MPTLKQMNCAVEWDNTKVPFKEYGAQYGDGVVECFIAIPEAPVAFTVHLQSKGYIAPGLAMFIYMDGIYQCNRNRFNLKLPDGNIPNKKTEVDFRVRQKEERRGEGGWIGRSWRFENLRIVNCGVPDDPPPKEHFDDLGTIQIIVLRCQPRGEASSLMQFSSHVSTQVNSPISLSGARTVAESNPESLADIVSIDGSKDKTFRFGLDGPTDWGTSPTWGFNGRDSNQAGYSRQGSVQGPGQRVNHHGDWDRTGPPNSPTSSLLGNPHPGPSRGGFQNTPYRSEHGGEDRNRSEWGGSQYTVGPSASVSQVNYPAWRMNRRPNGMLTPTWHQHGGPGPGSNWGNGSEPVNRRNSWGNRSNIGSQLGGIQYGGVRPAGSEFGRFNNSGRNGPNQQQSWNNNGGNDWNRGQNSGSFGGGWHSNNDSGDRYGEVSNAGSNNDGPSNQGNSWGDGGGSDFNDQNNAGNWNGANNSSNLNNQGGSNYDNDGNNASNSNAYGGSNDWGNGNDNGNPSGNHNDCWGINQGRDDNRGPRENNEGNGNNTGSSWRGSQGNHNAGGSHDAWQNDNSLDKNDSGGNDTWGNDNNPDNNASGCDIGDWGNNDGKNGSSGGNDAWGPKTSNSEDQGSGWDSGNNKNGNSGSNDWGNSNDNAQGSGNNSWDPNTSTSKPASVAGSQGPGFAWVTPLGSAQPTDEPPLYTVPEQVAQDMKASHQVQPGQSVPYTHKLGRPSYMDSFEEPYARFIFRYRTKETIEQELGITIERDRNEEKRRLATLSKDQIIDLLLGAQDGHRTQTCTPMPCSPASYSPSQNGQPQTLVTPKNIKSFSKPSSSAQSQAPAAGAADVQADAQADVKEDDTPKSPVASDEFHKKSPFTTGDNTTRNTRANTVTSAATGKLASIPPGLEAGSTSVPAPPEPTPCTHPTSSHGHTSSSALDVDALTAKLNDLKAREDQGSSVRSPGNSAVSHGSEATTQATMPGAWNFEGKDERNIDKTTTGGITPNPANRSRAASSAFGFDGQNQDRIGGVPTSIGQRSWTGSWNPWTM